MRLANCLAPISWPVIAHSVLKVIICQEGFHISREVDRSVRYSFQLFELLLLLFAIIEDLVDLLDVSNARAVRQIVLMVNVR